jgi:hypothetical protein
LYRKTLANAQGIPAVINLVTNPPKNSPHSANEGDRGYRKNIGN